MTRTISGVLPILHTPLTEDDRIDHASLKREIDWALSVGADGVCTAMVSEVLRLTTDERNELTDAMVELVGGRGVVVASVGAESIKAALGFARRAQSAGCDAIMAIPPISTSLPYDALRDYFATLADAVPLPLIVQDASGYVGRPLPLELMVELLEQYGPEKLLFKETVAKNSGFGDDTARGFG